MKFSTLFLFIFVIAIVACDTPTDQAPCKASVTTVTPSHNPQPSCESDEDCGIGNLCGLSTDGNPVCVTAESVPSNSWQDGPVCYFDADCPSGYTCQEDATGTLACISQPACLSDADCSAGFTCDTSLTAAHLNKCVQAPEPTVIDCPTAYLAGHWKSWDNYVITMRVKPDCTVLIDSPDFYADPHWKYDLKIDDQGNVMFDYRTPVDGWAVTFQELFYNEFHEAMVFAYNEAWSDENGVPAQKDWAFVKQD